MALRDRIVATVDPNVPPDAAGIDITLPDDDIAALRATCDQAIERPMTDADLEKSLPDWSRASFRPAEPGASLIFAGTSKHSPMLPKSPAWRARY